MPGYHHADFYNNQIKRKCTCGGAPEMLCDFVGDFIVRCKKCHISTHAYITQLIIGTVRTILWGRLTC